MPKTVIHACGTIRINGEPYRLARTDERKQAWGWEDKPQPPWDSGAPPMLSIEESTWHLGGFKSREAIPGTSEYGTTDCRWPYQELPGPKVNSLAIGSTVQQLFMAGGYIWVVTNDTKIYRITPATLALVLSMTGSFTPAISDQAGFQNEDSYPVVAEVAYRVWKCTAIVPGGPDTWANTGSWSGPSPWVFVRGIDRVYMASIYGRVKNCSTGLDPRTEANWADSIQCGDLDTNPRTIVAYGNTILVGKPDGLYGVSADEGIGVSLLHRMPYGNNCSGMAVIDPDVYVPHQKGLYRVRPGISVESVGLEREVLNTTASAQGMFRNFAVDNQWIYAAFNYGSSGWILVGRERRSGEPGFGPIIWDTFVQTADNVRALMVCTATNPPTLWWSVGINTYYIKLPTTGGIPGADCAFAASSYRYSPRYNFGDWNNKDFPKLEVACRGVSASRYWTFAYQIDDSGSWTATDKDGNTMSVTSLGVKTFYLPATAVGREIQFRRIYTGPDADTTPGSIVYFKPFAVPQSKKLPVITAIIHCAEGMHHDREVDARDAITQFNNLHDLSKLPNSVVTYGPWTRNDAGINAWVRDARLLETVQEGEAEPELLVQVALQLRETS